ncbi:MAG: phospholipase effector Tle1 domain-containing protein [Gammaproteobacteria bacterium]
MTTPRATTSFSRGAFTVRVLAGLLFRCGLLLPKHRDRHSQAFKLYEPHFEKLKPDELTKLRADIDKFRRSYSRPCKETSFLGIWDTVKSVGYIWPKSLPHTRCTPIAKTVRHALSIGESRSFFVPTTWGGLDGDTERPIEGRDVKEIWFAGNHSDVGGGYEEEKSDLAKISLKWMINEACACGLRVDRTKYDEMFARDSIPPFTSHDELEKWSWRISDCLPRWELENDPPPPRRLFRWGPSGRRSIGKSARNGVVLIDSRAKEFYSTKAPPWSDIDSKSEAKLRVQFVNTTDGASV